MQGELHGIDLSRSNITVPAELAATIRDVRDKTASGLNTVDRPAGWTPAYSLGQQGAQQTADFLVYAALTTVAHRPGKTWTWTDNWPYEPLVGSTPTTNTFRWTWISFCFTVGPLTPSQRKAGKVFPDRGAGAADPDRG